MIGEPINKQWSFRGDLVATSYHSGIFSVALFTDAFGDWVNDNRLTCNWNGAWGYRNEAHTGGLQKVGGIGEQLTNRLFAEAQPADEQPRAAV